jgi:hypothetical protein
VLLPVASPDKKSPANDYQGFWPGLETANADFVFQNVIFNWNPILSPESGLCSLPGAASKFPILLSIQPTYFTYDHSS